MLNNRALNTKKSGFTLIELVVVIVILGILAATATPKFLNLSSDANKAVLEAMGGAILSSAQMVHAKSLVKGVQDQEKTEIDLDNDGVNDVEIAYGYPSASRGNGISKLMGSNFAEEWAWSTTYGDTRVWLTTASLAATSGQKINQVPIRNTNCYILYDPATSIGALPAVSYVTTDC